MTLLLVYPESVLFYTGLIGFVCLLSYVADKKMNNAFFYILATGAVIIVSGVRGNSVGVDTPQYVSAYLLETPYYFEVGFAQLIDVLRPYQSPVLFLMFCAILIYVPVFSTLWKLRNQYSVTFLTFAYMTLCLFASWNGFRSYIALSIVFFCLRYLIKNQYFRFIAGLAIACLFQKTAIILIVLPIGMYLINKEITFTNLTVKELLTGLFLFLVVACSIYYVYYSGSYDRLFETYSLSSNGLNFGISYLLLYSIVLYGLIRFLRGGSKNNMNKFVCLFALVCVFSGILSFMSLAGVGRLSSYFLPYLILFLAWIWDDNGDYRLFVRIALVAYCMYVALSTMASNGQLTMPYQTFWM